VSGELRKYLRSQARRYAPYKYLRARRGRVKARSERRGALMVRLASVAGVMAAVLLSVQAISVAMGGDLFKALTDWGKEVLSVSTEPYEEEDVLLYKYNETEVHENIEEALKSIDEGLLYPSSLPDKVYVKEIIAFANEPKDDIVLNFEGSAHEISYKIAPYEEDGVKSILNWTGAKESSKLIQQLYDDVYQAEFVDSSYRYRISCADRDTVVYILENLKPINSTEE
jgi:hypothetical protein